MWLNFAIMHLDFKSRSFNCFTEKHQIPLRKINHLVPLKYHLLYTAIYFTSIYQLQSFSNLYSQVEYLFAFLSIDLFRFLILFLINQITRMIVTDFFRLNIFIKNFLLSINDLLTHFPLRWQLSLKTSSRYVQVLIVLW